MQILFTKKYCVQDFVYKVCLQKKWDLPPNPVGYRELRELEECPGWVLENIYKIEKIEKITDLKKETNKKKRKHLKL